MSSTDWREQRSPNSLSAAISTLVVRLFSEYTGRGPTKARTVIRDNIIVCITEDGMTKGERRLVLEGQGELVVSIRRTFQSTMREDLCGGVELLTGRRVISFLSDHNAYTDHAAEIFILDGEPIVSAAPNGANEISSG